MGWQAAVVGALGVAQYQQQGAIGKYNQGVANRNALVAEQEAIAIEKQTEFNLAKFDKQFSQLQGQTKVATLKSGATLSGTALNNLRYNMEQSKIQKNVIEYNSKVAANKKIEEANFARVQGNIARQQAKLAQLGTITSTGTSLLKMGGYIA
tara:strand:- start:544 stop:999 length:456 start_codon:yes stop_codon:yes gene_type:complete